MPVTTTPKDTGPAARRARRRQRQRRRVIVNRRRLPNEIDINAEDYLDQRLDHAMEPEPDIGIGSDVGQPGHRFDILSSTDSPPSMSGLWLPPKADFTFRVPNPCSVSSSPKAATPDETSITDARLDDPMNSVPNLYYSISCSNSVTPPSIPSTEESSSPNNIPPGPPVTNLLQCLLQKAKVRLPSTTTVCNTPILALPCGPTTPAEGLGNIATQFDPFSKQTFRMSCGKNFPDVETPPPVESFGGACLLADMRSGNPNFPNRNNGLTLGKALDDNKSGFARTFAMTCGKNLPDHKTNSMQHTANAFGQLDLKRGFKLACGTDLPSPDLEDFPVHHGLHDTYKNSRLLDSRVRQKCYLAPDEKSCGEPQFICSLRTPSIARIGDGTYDDKLRERPLTTAHFQNFPDHDMSLLSQVLHETRVETSPGFIALPEPAHTTTITACPATDCTALVPLKMFAHQYMWGGLPPGAPSSGSLRMHHSSDETSYLDAWAKEIGLNQEHSCRLSAPHPASFKDEAEEEEETIAMPAPALLPRRRRTSELEQVETVRKGDVVLQIEDDDGYDSEDGSSGLEEWEGDWEGGEPEYWV